MTLGSGSVKPVCKLALFCILAISAEAHVISMSTGDLTIRGNLVEYLVRMPAYEMRPGTPLFDRVRLRSRGESATQQGGECHLDASSQQYLCAANYVFTNPPGDIEVYAAFYKATVPNHVHMLRAERDGRKELAVFDSTSSTATLTFRPPTKLGIAATQAGAGAVRVYTSLAQILLIGALAFAASSHRGRLVLATAYFGGVCTSTLALLQTGWQPSGRFAEAAVALALAYLGLELLLWPKAGGRWVLALLFGGFTGMYFGQFVRDSGYKAPNVLVGSILAGASVFLVCGILPRPRAPWLPGIASSALLATGAAWFVLRLIA